MRIDGPAAVSARWVFPVTGPPIENGVAVIEGGRTSFLPAGARRPDRDLGNAAVLPGLVNPHTHLDLGGLRGHDLPRDFLGWLRAVIAYRQQRTPEQTEADIESGIKELLKFGTAAVGDIAAGGASWDALSRSPLAGVCYHELIGVSEERTAAAREAFSSWGAESSPRLRVGVTPHAPYSVSRELFAWAAGLGVPAAVHVAEPPFEAALLEHGSGPLRDFLDELGVWRPGRLVASHDELVELFAGAGVAWVHGNHLPAGVGASRIYCPRTHARFGFGRYPLRESLAAGATVALATDGLGSSPDLDVLAEARSARRLHPEVADGFWPRAVTVNAAGLLGLDWRSLGLTAVPLPDAGGGPYDLLLGGAD